MKRLNKKGFTLVELLAVIVVLALLMVVAAGSIGTALDNSKKSALKTEAQKVLTSAAQDAVTANMLDNTKATSTDPYEVASEEGDYKWYIKATVSGGVATINKFCVLYSPSTTSYVTTGKYSLGSTSDTTKFTDLESPAEFNKKDSCTITEGTSTTDGVTSGTGKYTVSILAADVSD